MKFRKFTIWLLLGYLALLLNVGPSAHHADFFGLHGDNCCDQTRSAICGCEYHHEHARDEHARDQHARDQHARDEHARRQFISSDAAELPVSVDSYSVQDCRCTLCEYFDCFSAITASFDLFLNDAPARFRVPLRFSVADASAIPSKARGPPALA